MPTMVKSVRIESKITNHSLRRKTCQMLLSNDVPPNLICQLTGHKRVENLNSYVIADLSQQHKMSNLLTEGKKDEENLVIPTKKARISSSLVKKVTSGMLSGATVHRDIEINVNYHVGQSTQSQIQVANPRQSE